MNVWCGVPVCIDIEAASQTTDHPYHGEHQQLLRGVGELHGVAGAEHGHDRLLVLEDDGQQAEHDGADDGREEASPVVPHSEVHAGYLDAERKHGAWL